MKLDLGGEGKGGVSGFCWYNRKKPVLVPETGMLGMLQVWSGERMSWVRVACQPPKGRWGEGSHRTQPTFTVSLLSLPLLQTGPSGQSILRVHLGQDLESSLGMER